MYVELFQVQKIGHTQQKEPMITHPQKKKVLLLHGRLAILEPVVCH